ncbi:MAG: hypothetical protein OWP43_12790 [Sphaerochaetaceae bacterium]|nr:hypothetical protein [Sphaerochaetaceae bacterium]
MKNQSNVINIIIIISKCFALSIVALFLIMGIGEYNSDDWVSFASKDLILLLFVPIIFGIGAFLSLKKEVSGSITMISSVIFFKIFASIFENKVDGFDFTLFLLPGLIILFINTLTDRNSSNK